MLHATLERRGGRLRCSPSNHVKIDAWSGDGLPPNSDVVVAADSSAAAIGAALRLTFNRCLDTYGQKKQSTLDRSISGHLLNISRTSTRSAKHTTESARL